jgi:hypothetical protein
MQRQCMDHQPHNYHRVSKVPRSRASEACRTQQRV